MSLPRIQESRALVRARGASNDDEGRGQVPCAREAHGNFAAVAGTFKWSWSFRVLSLARAWLFFHVADGSWWGLGSEADAVSGCIVVMVWTEWPWSHQRAPLQMPIKRRMFICIVIMASCVRCFGVAIVDIAVSSVPHLVRTCSTFRCQTFF